MEQVFSVDNYRSFADVSNEVRDVYIDDILSYVIRFSDELIDCLQPAPNGIYIKGHIDPLIDFSDHSKQYYSRSAWHNKKTNKIDIPDIVNQQSFLESTEPIYDDLGRVIMKTPPFLNRSIYLTEPSHHYSGIYLVLNFVNRFLMKLNPNSMQLSRIFHHRLSIEHFVKEESMEIFDSLLENSLQELTRKLYDFVGRDYFHVYSLKINNTTMLIEKGNDFRVIEYYRRIFEMYETERFEKYGH